MKRLFGVRNSKGRVVSDWFASKKEAKAKRKELGEHHYVTHGPDHWRKGGK